MLTVTGTEWLIAPDVPVTVTVAVAFVGLFAACLLELLLPHATVKLIPTTSSASMAINASPFPFVEPRLLRPRVKKVPKRPKPEISSIPVCPYPPPGAVAAAAIVRVDEAVLDPGEIELGEKVQVRPVAGAQESAICPLKPPTAADAIDSLAVPPAVTVTLCAERFSEKFVPAALAGTSVANRPLV